MIESSNKITPEHDWSFSHIHVHRPVPDPNRNPNINSNPNLIPISTPSPNPSVKTMLESFCNSTTPRRFSNYWRFCIMAAILYFRALEREAKMPPYFFLMFISYSNEIR